jgi:hypothetical protein
MTFELWVYNLCNVKYKQRTSSWFPLWKNELGTVKDLMDSFDIGHICVSMNWCFDFMHQTWFPLTFTDSCFHFCFNMLLWLQMISFLLISSGTLFLFVTRIVFRVLLTNNRRIIYFHGSYWGEFLKWEWECWWNFIDTVNLRYNGHVRFQRFCRS